MQWATPSRILVFVPSMILEAWCAVRLMPFSTCKLPFGTTKLELVTSGRSVWISLWLSRQYSAAEAATISCASSEKYKRDHQRGADGIDGGQLTSLRWVHNRASRQGRTAEIASGRRRAP